MSTSRYGWRRSATAASCSGLIVVERPAAADIFAEDDDRVLTELARQVGLAFHNAQLDAALQTTLDELRGQAEALRESRARIVASGDAERRRVERNLHDGAQQNLVALAVNLRLTRDIIADDPDAAAEMLDQIAAEVKRTIQELRELAHGIYPPLLADSGLGEALRAAASRSPLAVSVTAADIGRYSAEIEAAVYFCCLEALQNAAKHALGASVEIRIWEESGGLLFLVSDDGPGFDADLARRGHGFVNMADRLGAIGGTVRWQSEPGRGAQIRGSIPLVYPQPAGPGPLVLDLEGSWWPGQPGSFEIKNGIPGGGRPQRPYSSRNAPGPRPSHIRSRESAASCSLFR